MKFLLIIILLTSPMAYSALNMKPGLWKVKMKMKAGGKEINPSAEIEKAMAQMPEAQKKKMQEMMGKMKVTPGQDGGVNVCYTKAMIDKPEKLGSQKDKKCDTKVITQTSNKVVTNFECKDGTKGDGTWNITSPTSYNGLMNMVSSKGEKSQVNFTGNFLTSDCGKVKPMN